MTLEQKADCPAAYGVDAFAFQIARELGSIWKARHIVCLHICNFSIFKLFRLDEKMFKEYNLFVRSIIWFFECDTL